LVSGQTNQCGPAVATGIGSIDWPAAARDVQPFLDAAQQAGLRLWSERFFVDKVARMRFADGLR
jgi:hypothetical protein